MDLNSQTGMAVLPQRHASKMASWTNTYCSCTGEGLRLKSCFHYRSWNVILFFFFFSLSHACYAYLAQFHVETNYTLCYVTALWAYFIHHWMWGLMYSFQIYKSNGKSPALGMLGQNRAGPGGNSRRQLQGNGLFIMENLVCASDQWQ